MTADALLGDQQAAIRHNVQQALLEDLHNQPDITAQLVPEQQTSQATIVTREAMILCGLPWALETCQQVSTDIEFASPYRDGERLDKDTVFATLKGPTRALLTAERSMLNFIQLLSATATSTRRYADALANTQCRLLDTRKTIPGLRLAQKYAVRCGGGHNHRFGLYDAFLVKENHIAACGSITAAVTKARQIAPDKKVEVETENLIELREAIAAGSDIIMLDNFSIELLTEAVNINHGRCLLEASGNVSLNNIADIAQTGIDFISVGAITKNIAAIDLSMRITA